jgi:hypothetical protein
MALFFIAVEINYPLLIPKEIAWISDIVREAHEKDEIKFFLTRKLMEDEALLRQNNLPYVQNSKDYFFKVRLICSVNQFYNLGRKIGHIQVRVRNHTL